MNDPMRGSGEAETLRVDASNALASDLIEACRARSWRVLSLPNEAKMIAVPLGDFDVLHEIFNDRDFVTSLESAVEDFRRGRGMTLGPDESLSCSKQRAFREPEIVEGLENATRDFEDGRGRVLEDD